MKHAEMFVYDERSPSCLVWKIDRYGGKGGLVIRRSAGSKAGGFSKKAGNWLISYMCADSGKKIFRVAHRIILELHGIEIPDGLVVDHINGDFSDNRIENLRVVSQAVNARNKPKRSDNTTGHTGVSWDAYNGYKFAVAKWADEGKQKLKKFSALRHGEEGALNLAIAYRAEMIELLNLKGNGYTERHGK